MMSIAHPYIQVVEFPTTSGGKKYDHLVGSSASGQKSDHLVGNLTTSCCQNKKIKTKTWGSQPCYINCIN